MFADQRLWCYPGTETKGTELRKCELFMAEEDKFSITVIELEDLEKDIDHDLQESD